MLVVLPPNIMVAWMVRSDWVEEIIVPVQVVSSFTPENKIDFHDSTLVLQEMDLFQI